MDAFLVVLSHTMTLDHPHDAIVPSSDETTLDFSLEACPDIFDCLSTKTVGTWVTKLGISSVKSMFILLKEFLMS